MPNFGEHVVGALLFGGAYWVLSVWTGDTGLLVLGLIAALLGGMTPDTLEPAYGPDHRGVFHWLVGLFMAVPAYLLINAGTLLFMVGAYCIGYSHFALDYFS